MLTARAFAAAWATRLSLVVSVTHSPPGLLGVDGGGQRATAQAAAVLLLHEGAEILDRLTLVRGLQLLLDHLLTVLCRDLATFEDVDHLLNRGVRHAALPRLGRRTRQPEHPQNVFSRLGGLRRVLRGTRQRAEQEQAPEKVWNSGAHDWLLEVFTREMKPGSQKPSTVFVTQSFELAAVALGGTPLPLIGRRWGDAQLVGEPLAGGFAFRIFFIQRGRLSRWSASLAQNTHGKKKQIRPAADPEPVAEMEQLGRFGPDVVDLDFAAGDRLSGDGARLEETCGPEPFVEADRAIGHRLSAIG